MTTPTETPKSAEEIADKVSRMGGKANRARIIKEYALQVAEQVRRECAEKFQGDGLLMKGIRSQIKEVDLNQFIR